VESAGQVSRDMCIGLEVDGEAWQGSLGMSTSTAQRIGRHGGGNALVQAFPHEGIVYLNDSSLAGLFICRVCVWNEPGEVVQSG
jgi:hypothetical protein